MKLWTYQYAEVYHNIIKNGFHRVSEEFVDDEFKPNYDWLVKKMEECIGAPPDGVKYPIWAYARRDGIDGKAPSFDDEEYGDKGDTIVLLELDIPENRILLSDMNAWDVVLLNGYYNPDDNTDEKWDARHAWLHALPQGERQKVKESSWDKIFEIVCFDPNDIFYGRGEYVQATFWEILAEDIVSVKFCTI